MLVSRAVEFEFWPPCSTKSLSLIKDGIHSPCTILGLMSDQGCYKFVPSLGGGGGQAYSRLSTTHCHISDNKLDSVVHVGVCA